MEWFYLVFDLILNYWWLVSVLLFYLLFKTPRFKGVLGEALVQWSARFRLPGRVYRAIHNVTLQTSNGSTQIDHVFVSCYGIFVIETKNMKGWIYGNENSREWTQKIHNRKFSFQNPLRQNYKHVKALESLLGQPSECFHSVVAFVGKGTFKTPVPDNVTRGFGYIRYVKSFTREIFSEDEVQYLVERIQGERLVPSRHTQRQHIRSLRAREADRVVCECPKCGQAMVLRTARKGVHAGKRFWGCSAYPACRGIKNLDERGV